MSLPRYSAYKDSGVAWLGEVPAHWDVARYKNVFKERDERSRDGSETLLSVSAYTGVSPRSEIIDERDHLTRAESLEGYKICYPNDLVMNIMLAWNRGLGVTNYHGIVSPAYGVFQVINGASPKFLDYMMRSDQSILYYKAFSTGVIDSRLRLYPDTFGALSCVLPPSDEQYAIAAFLDRETAKIDALIAEQEALLALLAEKCQATISHAVTRGLDPDVPMRESGIAWLGGVPAHWETTRLGGILDAIGDVDHFMPASVEQGVPYLMTGDLREFVSDVSLEGCKQVSHEDYFALSRRIKSSKGDVIMARYATIGTSMYVDVDMDFLVSYSCVTLKANHSRVSGLYLFQYMRSDAFRQGVEGQVNTNTQGNVGINSLKNISVVVPPIDEQTGIAAFVGSEMARIYGIKTEAERAITLLRERRAALIAAAVSGKIDVRSQVKAQAA